MKKDTQLIRCRFVVQNGVATAIEIDNPTVIHSVLLHHENFAIDGDIVLLEELVEYGDKMWVVHSIVTRQVHYIIGYVTHYKNLYYISSYNSKVGSYPILISNLQDGKIKLESNRNLDLNEEKLYLTKITSHPNVDSPHFIVEIVNEFGDREDPQIFLKALLIEQNIPHIFTGLQEKDADKATMPTKLEADRADLREMPFITIDGYDAKDFDDAVYGEALSNGNHRLLVAIADVSYFVKLDHVLDKEAYSRGTSIYFPNFVVPMLPEALSNGLCSLQPEVDRLVMVCEMEIDKVGNIIGYKVYKGIIQSIQRTTYDQVHNFLTLHKSGADELALENTGLYSIVRSGLLCLENIYRALLVARTKRGALDFNTVESSIQFDEEGNVIKIIPRIRNDAHKLIEEFMLAANVSVADFIESNGYSCLYRIHDKPSALKMAQLQEYVYSLGIKWKVQDKDAVTTKEFAVLLNKVRKLDNAVAIEPSLLRYMMLAQYSSNNVGHFGLAYTKYVHFTSPIRRYADLVIHRICKAILLKQAETENLDSIANNLLDVSIRADQLERTMNSYYKCLYAKSHLGNKYSGVITSVNKFGVFVYLKELMIDGLVHVNSLADDFYVFDEKSQVLVGRMTGITYSIGSSVEVVIAGVELDKMFINLEVL